MVSEAKKNGPPRIGLFSSNFRGRNTLVTSPNRGQTKGLQDLLQEGDPIRESLYPPRLTMEEVNTLKPFPKSSNTYRNKV